MKKGRTFFPLWIICFNREMEQKCLKRVWEKKPSWIQVMIYYSNIFPLIVAMEVVCQSSMK